MIPFIINWATKIINYKLVKIIINYFILIKILIKVKMEYFSISNSIFINKGYFLSENFGHYSVII